MLGQHVLIEIDNGQDTSINKTGIWLYSDFICKDGKKKYVWAKNEDGKIEKRYVEIGQKDEDNGDCEIKSSLDFTITETPCMISLLFCSLNLPFIL